MRTRSATKKVSKAVERSNRKSLEAESSSSESQNKDKADLITSEDEEEDQNSNIENHSPNVKLFTSSRNTAENIPESQSHGENGNKYSAYHVLLALSAVVFLLFINYVHGYYVSYSTPETNFTCNDSKVILEHLNSIKDRFSSQPDDTWYTFASGIHQLFVREPTGPAVFLLFHEPDDRTVNCLVKEVSDFAARCFNGKARAFSVTGKTLSNDTFVSDTGELLVRFESEIRDKKVMIVDGLNDVHPEVAKEFHYFCDIYQPFIKEAVYFFTLKRATSKLSSDTKFIKVVNNELKTLWKTLSYDKLDALITRITENVVLVNNEEYIDC